MATTDAMLQKIFEGQEAFTSRITSDMAELKKDMADFKKVADRMERVEETVSRYRDELKDLLERVGKLEMQGGSANSHASTASRFWPTVVPTSDAGEPAFKGRRASCLPPERSGDRGPCKFWVMGFPRPLLQVQLRRFLREALSARLPEGMCNAASIQAGNLKQVASISFAGEHHANHFIEMCQVSEIVYEGARLSVKPDRSAEHRRVGKFTGTLWTLVKDHLTKTGKMHEHMHIGSQGPKGLFFVADQTENKERVYGRVRYKLDDSGHDEYTSDFEEWGRLDISHQLVDSFLSQAKLAAASFAPFAR